MPEIHEFMGILVFDLTRISNSRKKTNGMPPVPENNTTPALERTLDLYRPAQTEVYVLRICYLQIKLQSTVYSIVTYTVHVFISLWVFVFMSLWVFKKRPRRLFQCTGILRKRAYQGRGGILLFISLDVLQ